MMQVHSAEKHPARKPGKPDSPQGANLWQGTVPAGVELGLVFLNYLETTQNFYYCLPNDGLLITYSQRASTRGLIRAAVTLIAYGNKPLG
jgi:hypothetical protein